MAEMSVADERIGRRRKELVSKIHGLIYELYFVEDEDGVTVG